MLTQTSASLTEKLDGDGLSKDVVMKEEDVGGLALVFEGSFNEHRVASDPVIDRLLSP